MDRVGGALWARYPHLFDFYMALGERVGAADICAPVRNSDRPRPGYGAVSVPPTVRIIDLPHWSSAPMLARRFYRIAPAAVWTVLRNVRRWDLVGAVVPSVVGDIFISVARLFRRPTFLMIRGEKQRTLSFIMGGRSRALRPFLWALRAMEVPVRRWVRAGVPTFVAGEELVERYAAEDARLFAIYPSMSRGFPFARAPRVEPRHEGEVELITVSRLSPEKGIDDLLRALALVRAEGTDVRLTVVGDGPQREDLRSLAAQLGLAGQVTFEGFVPHGPALVRLLDRSDVFVLASRSEGVPHSLIEAMARALPVLSTDVGGIGPLLRGGVGVLVPSGGRPEELASALRRLVNDPDLRASLSVSSFEAAKDFHPERRLDLFCARLEEAYPGLAWSGGLSRRRGGRASAARRPVG